MTGTPHLGLMIAERSHLMLFGPIRTIAFNAPDLGTTLCDCMRRMPFYDRASVASIAVEGDMARQGHILLVDAIRLEARSMTRLLENGRRIQQRERGSAPNLGPRRTGSSVP